MRNKIVQQTFLYAFFYFYSAITFCYIICLYNKKQGSLIISCTMYINDFGCAHVYNPLYLDHDTVLVFQCYLHSQKRTLHLFVSCLIPLQRQYMEGHEQDISHQPILLHIVCLFLVYGTNQSILILLVNRLSELRLVQFPMFNDLILQFLEDNNVIINDQILQETFVEISIDNTRIMLHF